MKITPLSFLVFASLLAAGASGCQSAPYCLNCTEGDLSPIRLDLSDPVDQALPEDLAGADFASPPDLSQCQASNGGVEICDGIDNDCNGTIDDNVDPSKLQSDPNNCGACGTKCTYFAEHREGMCQSGACMPGPCLAGYYDEDGNPADCEYRCTKTNNGIEICDGQDNDCDGDIDTGAGKDSMGNDITVDFGYPTYATDAKNCGACGNTCGAPNAVTACSGTGTNGQGQCHVTACNNDGNGTYRHNPADDATTGGIDVTGCEYKCPQQALNSGNCNANGACTFPAELCDGLDNDCDFTVDNNLADPAINVSCDDPCQGAPNCGGASFCQPGTTQCVNGAPACVGGQAPMSETCDGLDNNCDGQIDEPFGGQNGLYNTDPNNCGGCFKNDGATQQFSCTQGSNYANWNAVKGCHGAGNNPGNPGVCYVVACNEGATGGYRHRQFNAGTGTCTPTTTATEGPTGTGCDYQCPKWPLTPSETCNGQDDDCDGCIDESLTRPEICSNLGACNSNPNCAGPCTSGQCPLVGGGTGSCAGSRFLPTCSGVGGWVCQYNVDRTGAAETIVDFVAAGQPNQFALAGSESKCDQRDNNCNNVVDTDGFPEISYSSPQTCLEAGQQGACQRQGTYACGTGGTHAAPFCSFSVPPITPGTEICDGKDNDCDGLIDEPRGTPGSNASFVVEAMKPVVNGGTTFWIYTYEASRPTATATTPGVGDNVRACSKYNARPWNMVTYTEAVAACAAAGLRLCTEVEWTLACTGAAGNDYPYGDVFNPQACNGKDYNPGNPVGSNCGGPDVFEGVLPTGTVYGCPTPAQSAEGSLCKSQDGVIDLSGNVKEWTSTPASGSTFAVKGGAYDNISSGLTCGFDFTAFEPDTELETLGFRCCSDTAPTP